MFQCVTCSDTFDSERAMKVHHKMAHGESLAKETSTCDVVGCDNKFSYYPSEKEGLICPECIDAGENIWDTDEYDNLAEQVTTYEVIGCAVCGEEMVLSKSDVKDRNFCSEECISEFNSRRISGEGNPRYVDGNSRGKNYNSEWRKVKETALELDGYECVVCSDTENLHGHHIIPVRKFENESDAHYIENVISVCAKCHRNIEYGNIEIPYGEMGRELEKHKSENFKYLHE